MLIISKTYNLSKNYILTSKFTKINTAITALLTMAAAAAGAFTSKYGASLSCNSWPGCNDSYFTDFSDMFELIHYAHRVIALFLFITLAVLFFKMASYYSMLSKKIKYILGLIFFIIIFQIMIGALLIYFGVPIWLGVFHQETGLMLFTLITMLYLHMKIKD